MPRMGGNNQRAKHIPDGMNSALAHRWCNSHRQHRLLSEIPEGYFDGLPEAVEKYELLQKEKDQRKADRQRQFPDAPRSSSG